ncbi:hypothetical protein APY04_3234 [Hyphomicrobium sulfonivorans]|uniref:Uncharacterized protein n=1 Tax=Hyphomicrobium sulfonivorans TaxID=121290 RepID=A0A109B9A7_HYPSL|nr:hypothetical protein APY04_3234 [Hyphomicrobium sulfonivorans]
MRSYPVVGTKKPPKLYGLRRLVFVIAAYGRLDLRRAIC